MTADAWLTLVVVVLTVVVLVRDLIPPAATVLGAVIVLLVTDVIDAQQAFAGFSNPAPITVAALYVLARAIEKTGALQPLVSATLGDTNGPQTALARLLAPAAASSGFLNNTPIVAMLAPQVGNWADRRGYSPSLFLMPLSFAAILGGLVTLIGTSTNLLVSGLLDQAGEPPFGMFEITRVGLPVAAAGLLLIVLLAPRLLPQRRAARQDLSEGFREFVLDMVVVEGGPLDGAMVEAGGLRHLRGVFLVEIDRHGESIAPVSPTTTLHGGDVLRFAGKADLVVDLQSMRGLVSAEQHQIRRFDTTRSAFFEAVVGQTSPLVGTTLKQIEFRGKYQAAVLAIHRAGQRIDAKLGEVPLRVGDTLLLISDPGFAGRWSDRGDFLLVSQLGATPPISSPKAWLAAAIGLAVVVLAGTGLLPILESSLLGAVALVGLRVISPAEARSAVDLNVVILIAAAFGLGAAIEASGLAGILADLLIGSFGSMGDLGVLLGVVLATVILTELVTNNAAAVLVFPIAAAAAATIGADLRGFAVAIAIAASASFLTPIGYQTNTMVYGPGGYRFSDYARLGAPLTLLVVVAVVALVPVFWQI